MEQPTILITGVTGLIGRHLSRALLAESWSVVGFSRAPEHVSGSIATELRRWDPLGGPPDLRGVHDVRAAVHLAGEPIAARRWTEAQKRRIFDSRVVSTRNFVSGLIGLPQPPSVLISGSAVGFYGDRGNEELDERALAGTGFMADICKEWERQSAPAAQAGIRTVLLRTGVVLSRDGGALAKMLTPFKLGVAGKLGSGRQWFPWIHIEDIVGIILFALNHGSLSGPLNATAPNPVTNADFTHALAGALHRPAFIPVPESGLKAVLGEMATMLLSSERALPRAVTAAGYHFKYSRLEAALENLLG